MQIKITDERVEQVVPVALENIKAEIVEAKEQTFETLDEKGEVKLTTLNVIQPGKTTTLKDLTAEISDMEIALSDAEAQVLNLTAELQKKRDNRTQFEAKVMEAHASLQVALEAKPKEDLTPTEEILP